MHPFHVDPNVVPKFVTTKQLMADSHTLLSKLPEDISLIIGMARSGLCVASYLSMMLHLPMSIYQPELETVMDASHGWRLKGRQEIKGRALVVDDTTMSGNSFKKAMPVIWKQFPDAVSAAVYVNPGARCKPNYYVEELPHPHLLEWNLFNSVFSQSFAVDFDGILCHDCTCAQDDDGPRYLDFLRNVKPLYLPRRAIIPMIVTARLEKYRAETMAWLDRWHIRTHELVMGPWATLEERAGQDIAAYKAERFKEFMKREHTFKPPMFIESDKGQAQRIAKYSGGFVICPAAGRCYVKP